MTGIQSASGFNNVNQSSAGQNSSSELSLESSHEGLSFNYKSSAEPDNVCSQVAHNLQKELGLSKEETSKLEASLQSAFEGIIPSTVC